MPIKQESEISPGYPRISIITVSLNCEGTIAGTIRSVIGQTYNNYEYIVVDGRSKDGTREIIRSYEDGIDRFISEEDDGIYDAMNKGISLATGDVIGFIHADDVVTHKGVLSNIARAMRESKIDSVYGDLVYVASDNTDEVVRYWKSGPYNFSNFKLGWMPPHPTFYVKRQVYEELGGFNLNFGSAADYELMLRFLYKHRISTSYLPEILVKMRTGGTSNRSLKNRIIAHKNDWGAWYHNGLAAFPFWVALKPIRKIPQYF